MDSAKTDDELTISCRSTEYRISKKLIREIPYFKHLFNYEKSKNRIEVDFDEKMLKLVFDRIKNNCIFINTVNSIDFCDIAHFFGMQDLVDECSNCFHRTFSIDYLPAVIGQVTPTSSLLNSGALNAFICRYFLKIANSPNWSKFPVETVEYICKLDLLIHTEKQVFDAILKWVIGDLGRKIHFKTLLTLVRWCHMEPKHLADISKDELTGFVCFGLETLFSHDKTACNCGHDRTRQKYFISILKLNTGVLRVHVLDSELNLSFSVIVKLDESMTLNVIQDEHVSDIIFDSGRQMIRIDWKQKKYRLLNAEAYKSYYFALSKFIILPNRSFSSSPYESGRYCEFDVRGCSLLESAGSFVSLLVNIHGIRERKIEIMTKSNPTRRDVEFNIPNNFMATVLEGKFYLLTKDIKFYSIDKSNKLGLIELGPYEPGLQFDNAFITSSQAHDNRIIFHDKSTKEVFYFDVKLEKWGSMGTLCYGETESVPLTFTSALLWEDAIRPCLGSKTDSTD